MELSASLSPERRKEHRLPMDLSGQIHVVMDRSLQEPLSARILDISRSGLKLEADLDAPKSSLLSLSFQYNGEDSLCVGEVLWKRPTANGMMYGLQIIHWTYLTRQLAYEFRQLSSGSPDRFPFFSHLSPEIA